MGTSHANRQTDQLVVRLAGFEPATHGLEGRCSIQLSYGRLEEHASLGLMRRELVGVEGFEPPTSCSQSRRATRLRYTPIRLGMILSVSLITPPLLRTAALCELGLSQEACIIPIADALVNAQKQKVSRHR